MTSIKITRCDYTTEDGPKGGYQVRIGKGPGKSLYCGDAKHGGKRASKHVADEVKHALVILTTYFPELSIYRDASRVPD